MRQLVAFLRAFLITSMFVFTFIFTNDFVLNANWKPQMLEQYGDFGKGIWIAEAHDVNNDVRQMLFTTNKGMKAAAYYSKPFWLFPPIIKYNKGEEDAVPHELAHHYFATKMNMSERENWCNTFNWTIWSYDNSCSEGFAEFFGTQVISYIPSGRVEEYNVTDGVTKWRNKE